MTLKSILLSTALVLTSLQYAAACDPRGTCLGIEWCTHVEQGREYAAPLLQAIRGGDANGIGVDTAACQHKYGQGRWDHDSASCNATDYVTLGRRALNGPAACD